MTTCRSGARLNLSEVCRIFAPWDRAKGQRRDCILPEPVWKKWLLSWNQGTSAVKFYPQRIIWYHVHNSYMIGYFWTLLPNTLTHDYTRLNEAWFYQCIQFSGLQRKRLRSLKADTCRQSFPMVHYEATWLQMLAVTELLSLGANILHFIIEKNLVINEFLRSRKNSSIANHICEFLHHGQISVLFFDALNITQNATNRIT